MNGCGYLKLIRSEDTLELMRRPNEFLLLAQIAYRAKRTSAFSALGLEPGQALVGDYKSIGLTERQYRTAKKNLEKWGFSTFKATNKGTIATLIKSTVFDINSDSGDEQSDGQATDRRRASDEQATTNKNEKKEKKGKKEKIYTSDSTEIGLSAHLLDAILSWKPDFKKPNIQSWAKHIDLMIRLDGRGPDRIREVIDWCQAEGCFWRANILSTEKLRKQFDRIDAGMMETENGKRLSRNTNGQTAGRGGAARATPGKYDDLPYIEAGSE
ncbi:MAG: hypothetical protein ACOWWM_16290 [Desulfobacterales bacterium]